MVSTGERIRELRQKRGWSLNKLAKLAGLSQGYLSSVENGKVVSPTASALLKIAAALDTSVDYLLGRTDDPTPPPVSDDVDVIRADFPLPPPGWEELTEEQREEVRQITRRFEETIIRDILERQKRKQTESTS